LDLLDVPLVEDIVTDTELLDAEVCLECISDRIASLLRYSTVEDLEFHKRVVSSDQISNRFGTVFAQVRVSKLKKSKLSVRFFKDLAKLGGAVAIQFAVGYVQSVDLRVRGKH